MASWKDDLTEEQLVRIDEARDKAMKILIKNKPLEKKLRRLKRRFNKRWGFTFKI